MEYCDEGTLEEVSRLGLQEHVIRLYAKQITVAINVLHEHGIVHRDIKGMPLLWTQRATLCGNVLPVTHWGSRPWAVQGNWLRAGWLAWPVHFQILVARAASLFPGLCLCECDDNEVGAPV